MRFTAYLLILSIFFQIPYVAVASSIKEHDLVYLDGLSVPSSSSRPAPQDQWIGRVLNVSKGGMAEVKIEFRNGMPYRGPSVYKPVSDLHDSVTEKNGYSRGSLVVNKKHAVLHGTVLDVFSNGMVHVNWLDSGFQSKHGIAAVVLSDQVEHLDDNAGTPGLRVGATILIQAKIGSKLDLKNYFKNKEKGVWDKKAPYPVSELDLGITHQVGVIKDFSKVSNLTQELQKVTIEIQTENGIKLVSPTTVTLEDSQFSLETQKPDAGARPGENVVYVSKLAYKPFEFRGTVQRSFQNGILEVKWISINGKTLKSPMIGYLSASSLQSSPGKIQVSGQGIDIAKDGSTMYLALSSIERALKKPNVSYLERLEQIVRDRAHKTCIAKGLKGLASTPKVESLSSERQIPLFTTQEFAFVEIQDRLVSPWSLYFKQGEKERVSTNGRVGQKFSFEEPLTARDIPGMVILSPILVSIVAFLGAKAAVDAPINEARKQSVSTERAQYRLSRDKAVHKTFSKLSKKVPTLVFSELLCAETTDAVMDVELLPSASPNLLAHLGEVSEAVKAQASRLRQIFETTEGAAETEDAPPAYDVHNKGKGKSKDTE
ncbi:MAG: hypothetical protein ABIQ95_09455 [Bdellovibrionia bacterium]